MSHHLSYAVGNINYKNAITKNLGTIQELTDLGSGNYNALQVKFTKRESRNFSYLLSYTYSHNLDNGAAPFDLNQNNDLPQDPKNLRAEYASSDDDVRHNLVFSGLYRLPFGHGQKYFSSWSRTTDLLLGGCPPTNTTAAFVPNTDAKGNIIAGNAGRNIVTGPGYINMDFSLFKDFAVTERYKLQTRLESFNTLNTPHFDNPGGNLTDGTHYGTITSTNGQPRVIQIAAKFLF
jgi:hypothetical protein